MEKILLIEDDKNIISSIRLFLEERNLELEDATTGEEGLEKFASSEHKLVLLDLMLPDMEGLEVCRQLRLRSTVPIIILTAKDDTHEVVAGLSTGADDYITKPFEPQELVARIRSLLRRMKFAEETEQVEDPIAFFGELEIRPEEGRIFRKDREIHLTRTEAALFMELYKNKGHPVSREDLSQAIWKDRKFSTVRLIDIQISRLRNKLEVDVTTPRHILTVRKVGYKFEP